MTSNETALPCETGITSCLLDFIREGHKFLIIGHKEPDGDCIGSQLALNSALRRLGKETVLCSPGPFKRAEIKCFEHLFFVPLLDGSNSLKFNGKKVNGREFNKQNFIEDDVRVLLLDCSTMDRAGELEPYFLGLPMAVIDHHAKGDFSQSGTNDQKSSIPAELCYVEVNAPSTTIMIMKLISALGLKLTREEAEFLFFGLCTDTGFFRFVDDTGAETFEAATALIRSGANPKAAFSAIHDGKSLSSRKLLGQILMRAETFFDGKLILSSEEYDEIRSLGNESRDSDSLYSLLQTITGVEAIVIIRQESPGFCTLGFRSHTWVDVGNIASVLGGGGHKNAAAAKLSGTIEELKPQIIKAFEQIFKG